MSPSERPSASESGSGLYVAPDADDEPTVWSVADATPFGDKAILRKCDVDLVVWDIVAAALDVPSRPTPADVREAQAQALEDAAEELLYDGDLDRPGYAQLLERAAEYRVAATDDEPPREGES